MKEQMTDNLHFAVLKPDTDGSPTCIAASLGGRLRNESERHAQEGMALVWARVFFSDIINQLPAVKSGGLEKELGGCAVSYIEQPPACGCKVAIMACYAKHASVEKLTDNAVRIRTPHGAYICQSVRFEDGEVKEADGRRQIKLAFERHKSLLAEYRMTVRDNTVRTWIFVRDIDRNYADVVKGRNEFFARNGLTAETHFIASTGIGGYSDCPEAIVAADFLSKEDIKPEEIKYLNAPDHLNRTSEYGVSFERGTALRAGEAETLYISGTASIDRHGRCIHINDPEKQTKRLAENIKALLSSAGSQPDDIKAVIAYIRDYADRGATEQALAEELGGAPAITVLAKVCRPQWLVEAECVALRNC